ncbi:MAG: NAD-dependent epimerase/dehydratase family protein [Bacillota bacterium]
MKLGKILLTGGAGYFGSVLVGRLLEEGYQVTVLDSLVYGNLEAVLPYTKFKKFRLIVGDIRKEKDVEEALEGTQTVIHLAAIVGDPACRNQPLLAEAINYKGTELLARMCARRGIARFIFASTCSNYGLNAQLEYLDEDSPLKPLSLYAETKVRSEQLLLSLPCSFPAFSPVVLRFSTIYGLSPRMRFDLAVNLMTAMGYANKNIIVYGGNQWRPFLHVQDACAVIMAILDTPLERVRGEVFNAGFTTENYQIAEAAYLVKKIINDARIEVLGSTEDARSYKVSFTKLQKLLGLQGSRTIPEGIKEIKEALDEGAFRDFASSRYRNN